MKTVNVAALSLLVLLFTFSSVLAESFPENYIPFDEKVSQNRTFGSTSLSAAGTQPELVATFSSSVNWLLGVNSSGEAFGGGVFLGVSFFGSNIGDEDYVPVEIVFSTHPDTTTLCQTYRRDLGYPASGVGTFPGAAYDMSDPLNPRRLNILLVEDAGQQVVNLAWNPNTSSVGAREYVYIMSSDYDGTGLTYAAFNVASDASSMDVLYGLWAKLAPSTSLLQTLPATLTIEPFYVKSLHAVPEPGELIVTWNYNGTLATNFKVFSDGSPNPTTLINTVPVSTNRITLSSLTDGVPQYIRIEAVDALDNLVGESKEISATSGSVGSNISLVDFWSGRNRYGDCWGYFDPVTGHEIALICARDEGVSLIDIDLSPPTEVGFIPSITPGTDAKDVKIYNNYAIIVKENEPLQVVDISDVTNPVQVSTINPDGGGSHNCLVDGDHLFVVGNHGVGGLEIFDISNPASPVEVGSYQPYYYHDVAIRNDTLAAAGIYGDGIDLLDVSDRTNPTLISTFNYANSGAHNCEFSADGTVLFTGDEIGSAGNWTRVWDVSDPFNVNLLSEIIVDPSAVVHNAYHVGDLLFIAHYTEGLRIWDVSDPANPVESAFYDTYPQSGGSVFSGAWSVYPYFPSGRIIVSDMNNGLFVLNNDLSTSCCVGLTGNVDNDPGDNIDIADITALIDFLFISGTIPVCMEEANIDGLGAVDIGDLTALIDFLFISGALTEPCQ